MHGNYQIISFYEFKEMGTAEELRERKGRLLELLRRFSVFGTVLLASEGYNASLCSSPNNILPFLTELQRELGSRISPKSSYHEKAPFRKQEVRIKPEIVTLKKPVDISLGDGTHVDPKDWNALIADPDVLVLDTRNDYEFRSGTFRNAINPETTKFSELPEKVESLLGSNPNKKVAMFCTGGIRCEKFAPYLIGEGFREVYQLRGGILKYLEEVPQSEQLWDGECFVFDERISLDPCLQKGNSPDHSRRHPEKATD